MSFRSREQNQSPVRICGDLLQRDHPERPSHEGVIQASEIEDGPDRHPFWGRGSNGCKSLTRSELGDHFYGSFFQQRHHL